jgi:hypothetical protein
MWPLSVTLCVCFIARRQAFGYVPPTSLSKGTQVKLTLFAFFISMVSISALAEGGLYQTGCTQKSVDDAKDFFDRRTEQYNVGLASLVDVKKADNELLDVQVCARQISSKNYCAAKLANLSEILKIIQEEYKIGVVGQLDAQLAKNDYVTEKAECGSL